MNSTWTRRDFLERTAASAASLAFGAQGLSSQAPGRGSDRSPLRGRFLTHVSVVRVNQIEVTPPATWAKTKSLTIGRKTFVPVARPSSAAVLTAG
jgi:hypothetical protein